MAPFLGCIADDFTGATDLAGMLVRAGMRTIQTIGVPPRGAALDADAVVVALKSRTAPPVEAVADSLAALAALRDGGCRRFFFKYCSTFDSTDRGNIGPVADALLDALGAPLAIACPAFPENGRSVFMGHLFVGEVLLSESGMRTHPLTPMTDPSLVRVLQRQARRKVGLVRADAVAAGPDAIRARLEALRQDGIGLAIVDAVSDADLRRIGEACWDHLLVTGGSGVAMGLPEAWGARGLLGARDGAATLPSSAGLRAVVSGSCSVATAWAAPLLERGPVLVYATAEPDTVRAAQDRLGRERAGTLVEAALAAIAKGLVERGVGRLVVAGGETSGAVVNALGVKALRIGPQIAPGVPWTASVGGRPLALALKSGNFGAPTFFLDAWKVLP